jgi:hypothetical protein
MVGYIFPQVTLDAQAVMGPSDVYILLLCD